MWTLKINGKLLIHLYVDIGFKPDISGTKHRYRNRFRVLIKSTLYVYLWKLNVTLNAVQR